VGSVLYTLHQINTNGSDNYDLSGGGTNTYSQTTSENSLTGQTTTTGGGSDAYSLTQSGQHGIRSYTLTLAGTDLYTLNNADNSQTGAFSDTTAGGGSYALSETGSDGDTPFSTSSTGSTGFSQTQAGNLVDGQITLSQSGTNRYNLLEQFNNPSEAAQGAPGIAAFSPIGNPVSVGVVPAVTGTFVDPDARHLYCFAKGTLVLLADGSSKVIEKIEVGQMVLAAPDTDPEAPPTPCKVVQVYHNAPANIFEVHVAGEVIRTTANHPFYVKGKGWVKVKDLAVGDELRTANGSFVQVQRVADSGETEPVFNLQVELSHTYLVVLPESRQAILVHNESQSVVGGFFSDWGNYYKQAAQSTWNATKTAVAITGIVAEVGTQAAANDIRDVEVQGASGLGETLNPTYSIGVQNGMPRLPNPTTPAGLTTRVVTRGAGEAVGVISLVGGGGVATGGIVLDSTGVGAVAGVPANIAGVAAAGYGSAVLANAAQLPPIQMSRSGGSETAESEVPAWKQYEQRHGGQQTPMRTTFQGEEVDVRLDKPPTDSQIIDFKAYDWSNPSYQESFIQQKVIKDFQTQIAKYQTIRPNVHLQFSQQPPAWAIRAIQEAGATYSVKP
jgi:hypothetical protein